MKQVRAQGLRCVLFLLSAWAFTVSLRANGSFLYTNNGVAGANTVSAFSIGPNGVLAEIPGSPFATGGAGMGNGFFAPNRATVGVAGDFLYVSNDASSTVSAFSVDPNTGVLTPLPGSPFATGGIIGFFGASMATTPDGEFLMVANPVTFNISVFEIADDGTLALIAGSPFPAGGGVTGLKVSPDGRFLTAALPFVSVGRVAVFDILPSGALQPVAGSPFNDNFMFGGPAGLDINCSSDRLFTGMANFLGTAVEVSNIGANGALAPVAGSPFVFPGVGSNSNVVLLSPDDEFLFVSNQFSSTVTVLDVQAGGGLTLVPGSPFPAGAGAFFTSGMAIDQSGKFLFAANSQNLISAFAVANDGKLNPVPGSPFSTGQPPGLRSVVAFPPKSCFITVNIDIKTGDFPNVINPKSNGVINVAILTNTVLDAAIVDVSTVRFGRSGSEASAVHAAWSDVDTDGDQDLLLHFRTQDTGVQCGDTALYLKGKTSTGRLIVGTDSIRTVACK